MIGKGELALLIAQEVVKNTSLSLSPTKVAEVLGMSRDGARKKVENTAIKNTVKQNGSVAQQGVR